ncbi:lantibiotic dehydratase [Streptomyces sp. NPDC051555]|uniref:lantibiotic dehydratase n=1 Tax=Streptomyces sp. NPDC051555 TaxID=3365657 RepID=UPI0037BD5734
MGRPQGGSQPEEAGAYRVRTASYALVRATVLAHPAQLPPAAAFRTSLDRLHRTDARLLRITGPLTDALHDSRDGHPPAFHRDVVLPLRRALHNGREPRPALLERLGDLPARVPLLATWLALRTRRAELLTGLGAVTEEALAGERASLAALCREPALGRAVALTSADLLRAVERAGTGATDRRARKEEPTALRYALRASTKTSPLSWFTAVGWGPLATPEDAFGAATRPGAARDWGTAPLFEDPLHAVVKVNRTLTSALTHALLAAPHRRAALPHRITSTARITGLRAAYARERTSFAGGRFLVAEEDEVELIRGVPLRLVTEWAESPSRPAELAALLAAALKGAGGAGSDAAAAFLGRLVEARLLVPGEPFAPQDTDPLDRIASWLRTVDPAHPEIPAHPVAPADAGYPAHPGDPADPALADRILELGRMTAGFGAAPAGERPALLAGLSRSWAGVLADAGSPVPPASAPLSVLTEDVVAPRPLVVDGFLDGADHEALGEVTALAELFDLGHVVRRLLRDRFVERYGSGGTCQHPWEFGGEVAAAWEAAGRSATPAPEGPAAFPTGVAELAALRAQAVRAVGDAPGDRGSDPGDDRARVHEVVLSPDFVKGLGERLPTWAVERPLSYAYFVQRAPGPEPGLLCVNHVYGGWGRFTSRFLDALDPGARAEVSRQIHRGLGPGARAAQIRPVGGFNANLHPMLVPQEIGPDRRWASIGEADLDLVHDEATDQVRFRLRSTGEHLDVLYPGFLAPVLLPRRIGAHLADHPHGAVDFGSLVPRHSVAAPGGPVTRTPRLRHRHVVLRRRRWLLPPDVVRALRSDLGTEPVPAAATARWRALLDLPEQLFLHPAAVAPGTGEAGGTGGTDGAGAADAFLHRLSRPKPHLVDLGNPLHLRCLAKWLSRHVDAGAVLEEALPAPGGRTVPARAVELVLEVYRSGRLR